MFEGALHLVKEAVAAMFQPVCIACGDLCGPNVFCCQCPGFLPVAPPWCERCGRSCSSQVKGCGECHRWTASPLDQLRSGYWLTETAKELLHEAKYRGRFELFRSFLNRTPIVFADPKATHLVAVPLHWRKHCARSFNQSEVLAKILSQDSGLSFFSGGLEKVKDSPSQTLLTKRGRKENLQKAFVWKSTKPVPKRICLIDDTYTTGATLGACAQALKKAGSEWVSAWTLFRTPLETSISRSHSDPLLFQEIK